MAYPPPPPLVPNFNPTSPARLAVDRYDFEAHILGTNFRQNATTIDLSPPLDGYTTVQALLAGIVGDLNPTMPDATPTQLGLTTLGGDLNGIGTSAFAPKVSGLQGRPVQNLTPSAGQVLTWNGSLWGPASTGGNVTGPFTNETVVAVTGDVAGTLNMGGSTSTNVINIGGDAFGTAGSNGVINIGAGTFASQIIIGDSPASPQIQLGNGAGSVIVPNLSGYANAMVISTVGGQLGVTPGVTYTFAGTQSFNIGVALTVGFTNVTTFPYAVDSGATPDYLLLVQDAVTRIINLPAPTAGRVLKIEDASDSASIHNITINATGGAEFPGGGTTITIAGPGGGAVEIISDGTNWFITGAYNFP
jgi:hypothetical protein